jgi:peptide/nickel transport system substrate-binding protein
VRKAIALAINKQDLIDKLLYGITKPGRSEWDNTYWENKNLRPYPYDPEQAKKLLEDAGWKIGSDGIRAKGGQRLSFTHSTYTGDQLLENVQLFVQRNLKDVGVEMKIKNVALATAFASYQAGGTWATGQYEMGGWFHGLRNPDPDLSFRFHSGQIPSQNHPAGSQWYHYSNPQVDKLFDQQANIFDPAERKKVIDEIQRLIYEDYPVIYLYDFTSIYAVKMSPTPLSTTSFMRLASSPARFSATCATIVSKIASMPSGMCRVSCISFSPVISR